MLPDLRRLQQFVAVAEADSFTTAARRLHLSQQALSSSVRLLEAELATKVFRREGRRISLTPAGRTLLREARPLLAAARTVGERVWTVGHNRYKCCWPLLAVAGVAVARPGSRVRVEWGRRDVAPRVPGSWRLPVIAGGLLSSVWLVALTA